MWTGSAWLDAGAGSHCCCTATRSALTRGPVRHQVRLTWDAGFVPGPVPLSEAFGALSDTEPPTDAVSNWLGGYAPEGNQRTALAEARGVRPDDLFALLREYGGSIAGAVTLCPPAETPGWTSRYDPVSAPIVGRRLRQAVARHDLASHDDSRSMLVMPGRVGGCGAGTAGRAGRRWCMVPG